MRQFIRDILVIVKTTLMVLFKSPEFTLGLWFASFLVAMFLSAFGGLAKNKMMLLVGIIIFLGSIFTFLGAIAVVVFRDKIREVKKEVRRRIAERREVIK